MGKIEIEGIFIGNDFKNDKPVLLNLFVNDNYKNLNTISIGKAGKGMGFKAPKIVDYAKK